MKKDRDLAMKKKEELAAILMEAAKALKSSLMVGVCVSHTHTHRSYVLPLCMFC